MSGYVLALDQGTTSTRAIVFDKEQVIRGSAQEEFPQHYPASGWVEHDPEDLWRTALATMQAALAKAGLAARDIAGVGITNQRETAVVWDSAAAAPFITRSSGRTGAPPIFAPG
jgi:glycerol kinase